MIIADLFGSAKATRLRFDECTYYLRHSVVTELVTAAPEAAKGLSPWGQE